LKSDLYTNSFLARLSGRTYFGVLGAKWPFITLSVHAMSFSHIKETSVVEIWSQLSLKRVSPNGILFEIK